jgi:hypothetical protein
MTTTVRRPEMVRATGIVAAAAKPIQNSWTSSASSLDRACPTKRSPVAGRRTAPQCSGLASSTARMGTGAQLRMLQGDLVRALLDGGR